MIFLLVSSILLVLNLQNAHSLRTNSNNDDFRHLNDWLGDQPSDKHGNSSLSDFLLHWEEATDSSCLWTKYTVQGVCASRTKMDQLRLNMQSNSYAQAFINSVFIDLFCQTLNVVTDRVRHQEHREAENQLSTLLQLSSKVDSWLRTGSVKKLPEFVKAGSALYQNIQESVQALKSVLRYTEINRDWPVESDAESRRDLLFGIIERFFAPSVIEELKRRSKGSALEDSFEFIDRNRLELRQMIRRNYNDSENELFRTPDESSSTLGDDSGSKLTVDSSSSSAFVVDDSSSKLTGDSSSKLTGDSRSKLTGHSSSSLINDSSSQLTADSSSSLTVASSSALLNDSSSTFGADSDSSISTFAASTVEEDEPVMRAMSCKILVMIKSHTECNGLDPREFKTENACCRAQIDMLMPKRYQNTFHVVLKSGDIAGLTYTLTLRCNYHHKAVFLTQTMLDLHNMVVQQKGGVVSLAKTQIQDSGSKVQQESSKVSKESSKVSKESEKVSKSSQKVSQESQKVSQKPQTGSSRSKRSLPVTKESIFEAELLATIFYLLHQTITQSDCALNDQ